MIYSSIFWDISHVSKGLIASTLGLLRNSGKKKNQRKVDIKMEFPSETSIDFQHTKN
jgi:hypothetical protein